MALHGLTFFRISKPATLASLPSFVKLAFAFYFLNLAGLPPLSGFFIKLYALKLLIISYSAGLIIILLILSLFVLYAYVSVFYYFIRSYHPSQPARVSLLPKLAVANIACRWVILAPLFTMLS